MVDSNADEPRPRRRDLLTAPRVAAISLGGLCALTGCAATPAARADDNPEADVTAMNTAISVEHIGIAAYQHAAESGLLTPRMRALAVVFQGHHRQHRDAFSVAVQRIGGAPAQPRPTAEYLQMLGAPKNQTEILRIALGLERRAANAYLLMHRLIDDRELKYLLARFAGDEAMHWGMWAFELGETAPERAAVFG